jgi:hypothetical protein
MLFKAGCWARWRVAVCRMSNSYIVISSSDEEPELHSDDDHHPARDEEQELHIISSDEDLAFYQEPENIRTADPVNLYFVSKLRVF